MPLITKIQSDLKAAMLAKNDLVRDTLRLVMSEMKNRRIEGKVAQRFVGELLS